MRKSWPTPTSPLSLFLTSCASPVPLVVSEESPLTPACLEDFDVHGTRRDATLIRRRFKLSVDGHKAQRTMRLMTTGVQQTSNSRRVAIWVSTNPPLTT
jgi:hypothetical protein